MLSFRDFVSRANPKFVWYRHNVVLGKALQLVADGEIKRLMVFMPPRHGKSEMVSRLFPAYLATRFPSKWIALASYSAELAYDLSRAARRYFRGDSKLAGETTAVKQWETGSGGGFWAAGVGGSATGKGFDFGIVDDPVKDAKEAGSEVLQARNLEWWQSVFYTRAEPDAAIVVCQTRWNENDLAGQILAEELDDELPEGWHILSFPAIAEAAEAPGAKPQYPPACTVEPDWRNPGEALCPERYPLAKLKKIAKKVGTYFWNALYRQRPTPREGNFFKWAWLQTVAAGPAVVKRRLRYWDMAGTDDAGDWTVGALASVDDPGLFWLEDVARGQWSPARRLDEMKAVALRDRAKFGSGFVWWVEKDAGIDGDKRTNALIRHLAGIVVVKTERPTTDKVTRAEPLAAYAEAGNVRLVEGEWNHPFRTVLCDFPHGKHDDDVDAASGAYNKLMEASGPAFGPMAAARAAGAPVNSQAGARSENR